MRPAGEKPAERLFTFRSGGWVLLLAAIVTAIVAWRVLALRAVHRERVFGRRGDLSSYRFDLEPSLLPGPVEEAVEPVHSRNAIGLTDPGVLTREEMEHSPDRKLRKLLVPDDRVIGVVLGGEARAWPLRVLNFHEIVNDTLGGVPIAVTWHPLTECAAVFDRRLGGDVRELVFSGCLWRSSQLFFLRKPAQPGGESLFSQMLGRAVTGAEAAAGTRLTRVPSLVLRWGDWVARHPDTTLVRPDPRFRKQYSRMPYAPYRGSRLLRFDVGPRYPPPGPREAWSHVLVRFGEDGADVTDYDVARPPVDPELPTLYAYWWAWYATRLEGR